MMEIGLGILGLSPGVFWTMTPVELQAALCGRLGLGGGTGSITRNELDELMLRFPDRKDV